MANNPLLIILIIGAIFLINQAYEKCEDAEKFGIDTYFGKQEIELSGFERMVCLYSNPGTAIRSSVGFVLLFAAIPLLVKGMTK